MVRAICDQPPADDDCLHRSFGESAQLGFGLSVATQMGYDVARGRLDKTQHPFCTKFAAGDVRITTRVRESDLGGALFSTRGSLLRRQPTTRKITALAEQLICAPRVKLASTNTCGRSTRGLRSKTLSKWSSVRRCLSRQTVNHVALPKKLRSLSMKTSLGRIRRRPRKLVCP